jgi:hypothetical protein
MKRTLVVFLVLCGLGAFASGCGSHISSSSTVSIPWTSADKNAVPGIDFGRIMYTTADKKPIVVIWDDLKSPGGGSLTMTSNRNQVGGKGYIGAGTGGDPDVEFEATGQASGWIRFAEKKYDLKDGILFLVSTTAKGHEIKQLKRDMAQLTLTSDGCRAYAKGDDEIRAFFNARAK